MKEIILPYDLYYEIVNDQLSRLGHGIESTVYRYNDSAFKIFAGNEIDLFTKRRIINLGKLTALKDDITLPTALIYIQSHAFFKEFIGYAMDYAGIDLNTYLEEENLPKDRLIELLKEAKKHLMAIHNSNCIHGDISLKNILINGEQMKISDINNMIFSIYRTTRHNQLSRIIKKEVGNNSSIDIITFNFYTYALLAGKERFVEQLLVYGPKMYEDIQNENYFSCPIFFNDEAYQQIEIIKSPKLALTNDVKYLIDCINP